MGAFETRNANPTKTQVRSGYNIPLDSAALACSSPLLMGRSGPRTPGPPGNCTVATLEQIAPPGSTALADYLSAVYAAEGTVPRAAQWARHWRWDVADVVYLAHLPQAVRHCIWPRGPSEPGSLFAAPGKDVDTAPTGTVFRYSHHALCGRAVQPAPLHGTPPPRVDCEPEKGGPRLPPRVLDDGPWIEVSHTFIRGWRPYERTFLWMYKTGGSGVWYRTGRTAICSDTVDLARMLNLTLSDNYVWVKDEAMRRRGAPARSKRAVLEAAREAGFETVVLTHHVDAGHLAQTGRGYLKTEVVSLRPDVATIGRYSTCPPDPSMRGGWRASAAAACRCLPTPPGPGCEGAEGGAGRRAPGGSRCFPQQHVRLRCGASPETSAAHREACRPAAAVAVGSFTLRGVTCQRPPRSAQPRSSAPSSSTASYPTSSPPPPPRGRAAGRWANGTTFTLLHERLHCCAFPQGMGVIASSMKLNKLHIARSIVPIRARTLDRCQRECSRSDECR